jgi:transposase
MVRGQRDHSLYDPIRVEAIGWRQHSLDNRVDDRIPSYTTIPSVVYRRISQRCEVPDNHTSRQHTFAFTRLHSTTMLRPTRVPTYILCDSGRGTRAYEETVLSGR